MKLLHISLYFRCLLINSIIHLSSFSTLMGEDFNIEAQETTNLLQREATKEGLESLGKIPGGIAKFPSNPSDEQIIDFSRKLTYLNHDLRFTELRSEVDPYFDQVQSILLNTPGHAEAFKRAYDKAKSEVLSGKVYWSDVHRASEDLRILQYLPSPETMKVLGEMLEETKGAKKEDAFPRQPKDSFQMPSSAAEWAVVTLHEIGIEDPPDANAHYIDMWLMGDTMSFHPLWHTWWQEVKEGKRTYKFKGSDVVYDYDGPVKTFKKERSSTQASDLKPVQADRTVKRDAPVAETEPVSKFRGPVIWTIAAVVALLFGLGRLLIVKRQEG